MTWCTKIYLLTGIHWKEHNISQWILDSHLAHCTYNSEWIFIRERIFMKSRLFFFRRCFTKFPTEFTIHPLIRSEPSFLAQSWWKPLTYFSIVFRFHKHNSLCIETLHRPHVFRYFFSPHCSQQSLRASNIYTMIFFFLIIITIIIIILLYTKAQKVGSKAGVKLHKTAIILLMIFKHCTK